MKLNGDHLSNNGLVECAIYSNTQRELKAGSLETRISHSLFKSQIVLLTTTGISQADLFMGS